MDSNNKNIFNNNTIVFKKQGNQVQVAPQIQQKRTAIEQTSVKEFDYQSGFEPTPEQRARWEDETAMMQAAPAIAQKLKAIREELKQEIVEREDIIDAISLALITGHHLVMIGPPGIAKSLLARSICKRIVGGKYFEWLLNKTSDPSEILGPFSIKGLESDDFIRITSGKLPEAHIAFLDELYKSNPPTLNMLLPILNEKIFHNGTRTVRVPLISMFGASNELPEDDSLNALHDRMLFRFMVNNVHDASNRMLMYNGFLERRNPKTSKKQITTITIEELQDINHAAKFVVIPKNVLNQYDQLLMTLETSNQIVVTDRRKNEGLAVLQASAILEGRDVATVDDFRYLTSVWWQRPEDIKVVYEAIMKVVNPYEAKLHEEQNHIAQILANVRSARDDSEKAQKAVEAKAELNNVIKNLDKLLKDAKKNGKDTTRIEQLKQEVYAHQKAILNENLGITDDILESTGFGGIDGEV